MAVEGVDDDGDSWGRHFVDLRTESEERRCWKEWLGGGLVFIRLASILADD